MVNSFLESGMLCFIGFSIMHLLLYLQQALVGEESGEEQLFSSESSGVKYGIRSELDIYLKKLKVLLLCFLLSSGLDYISLEWSIFINIYGTHPC